MSIDIDLEKAAPLSLRAAEAETLAAEAAAAAEQPNLSSSHSDSSATSSSSSSSPTAPRRQRRASSLSTSAPNTAGPAASMQASGERRISRRERLSGRGFMPPASGGGFDEELDDYEDGDVGTTDVLLYLARRIACEFGANLAFNLPLRLVSLRQAARPLGRPQHSLAHEVKSLIAPSSASASSPADSWKYVLGTSAFIGMSEVVAGLFSGGVSMYFDSGHIPTVDEWHEHEKPTFYGVSRKQLAVFAGKLLTGVFFYPFFAVAPILLATHRWPGTGQFFGDLVYNRNGFWNALALNVAKYSIIDLAPFLETKLYHYLQLVPEGDEENEDEWEAENSSLFSAKRFIKYGLSFTSTALACLLYVPLDVLTTQMVVYPTQYSGVVDCARKVWAAEGLKGLYRGCWANLLSEQELLFI